MTAAPAPSPGEIAARNLTFAKQKRALAEKYRDWGDATGAHHAEQDAGGMETRAADALNPLLHTTAPLVPGNGGEMVAATAENQAERPGLIDVVRERPDMLTADASVRRLELAANAGAMVLAVETAATIQAENSLEKMLAHQMAAAHTMAMKMMAKADQFLTRCVPMSDYGNQQLHSVEATRMVGAAARLMDTYQRAMLTLDRIRNGGQQTMVVQHVAVADGGQAVVAGTMPAPTARKRRGAKGK